GPRRLRAPDRSLPRRSGVVGVMSSPVSGSARRERALEDRPRGLANRVRSKRSRVDPRRRAALSRAAPAREVGEQRFDATPTVRANADALQWKDRGKASVRERDPVSAVGGGERAHLGASGRALEREPEERGRLRRET